MNRITLEPLVFLFLILLVGCSKGQHKIKQLDLGQIEDNRLNEISGIDYSLLNGEVFWLHNDSGDSAQIFAIDGKARNLGRFKLKNIKNRDWEDITVGPGPVAGQSYIYIGEIGDNEAVYKYKYIYRIKEPKLDLSKTPYDTVITDIETITFQYPDGPRDAETLMIDPLTKDLIVISKREESVHVYLLSFPQDVHTILIPERIATIPLTQITAGDISDSGLKIIVKNYENIYYWHRKINQSLHDVFSKKPEHLPYIAEPQGEAICWSNDEKGYFTTSEEANNTEAHLYFYPLNQ